MVRLQHGSALRDFIFFLTFQQARYSDGNPSFFFYETIGLLLSSHQNQIRSQGMAIGRLSTTNSRRD